jgi:hypothetical protein
VGQRHGAAGKSVALMHFVFHQLDRSRARQARCAGLDPAGGGGGPHPDERDAIANFKVPPDNEITVPPLPRRRRGPVIQGRVVSGDGVTPIARAPVHIKSKSALFWP